MAEECSHECSSCGVSGCGDRTAEAGPSTLAPNNRTNVKHVIGVVSGKGGVGKSLVTSLLASEMNKRGHKVAILDADITGPSIPKSFGVDSRLTADADGINPAKSASGIEVMSVNLMLPEGDMPVAWRGPVVTGAIKQFWQEVNWGDVDYMFVDMPPGTSDVFLTVFQSLPVDGIVTVSAPQELVAMIVGKAVNLAKSLEVPVVGLVENMAYFKCDECGKEHHIFGEPQGAAVAEKYDIPAVATLPMDPTFARLVDEGKCIGCERCVEACPFTPSRVQWNFEDKHAQKCDLCKNTPFWDEAGGVGGKQLCVEICPMKAISFTNELPVQTDEGYTANLRNDHYLEIGLPSDDEARIPPARLGYGAGGTAAQAAAGSNEK